MNSAAQHLSLRARITRIRDYVVFAGVDPVLNWFRRYEFDASSMHPGEVSLVLARARELRRCYRTITVLLFLFTATLASIYPVGLNSASGMLGLVARCLTFAATLCLGWAWLTAGGGVDQRWFDMAFRECYFRNPNLVGSQVPEVRVYPPSKTHLSPPLHLWLQRPGLRSIWLPLPRDGRCDIHEARFARRRAWMAYELRRDYPGLMTKNW